MKNYTDWKDFSGDGNVSIGCCREQTDDCFVGMADLPMEEAVKHIYIEGCYYAIKADLQGATIGLGVACLILAIVQVSSKMFYVKEKKNYACKGIPIPHIWKTEHGNLVSYLNIAVLF